ncbi:carboxylesterase/lipase family protein [Piscinibacter sp. HJYY11]|uniref:carboxylesterase/lipase family protein n=1 Tax=Piscinibacter sp. HJYY11 TaxID=2801333 RepID=UPI00191E50E6|nr:carboxylesterase family protein [Piscinibacter sp. HJYY11]MBL0728404.1 carboxylesterase family protein [Piscinibacter sp. HJYY11]
MALLGAFLGGCSPEETEPSPIVESAVVTTQAGRVRGEQVEGVARFLGIPYAAPPVGALRWRPPQPPLRWDAVRPATAFGSPCVQSAMQEGPGSEDCLFLNVWTPEVRAAAGRPVLVYVHGGGWARGAGNMSVFDGIANMQDGHRLAQQDGVVVVTLNYRLSNLGFLAHPALAEAGQAGNYGVMDVIAALQWVQSNIREFGGDPRRVLLFGTSAGGSQTCAVAASPLARGLFSTVASHSGGGCDCFRNDQKLAVAQLVTQRVGCAGATDVAACLRRVPAADFVSLPGVGATADGVVLPSCPLEMFRAGGGPALPMVFGTNVHEGLGYLDDAARALTWESLRRLFQRSFPSQGDALAALYGPSRYDVAPAAWAVFIGDWIYHCPDRRVLRALEGRATPAFRYLFGGALSDPRHAASLAGHGVDVPFVFRTFGSLATTAAERNLSSAMATRWAGFASTGQPSRDGSWRPWDNRGALLALGLEEIRMGEGFRDAECDLLDRIPPLREQPSDLLPFPAGT